MALETSSFRILLIQTLFWSSFTLFVAAHGSERDMKWLQTFSVANENLSGPVPNFKEGLVTADSYANNTGLCGGPLAPCTKSSEDGDNSFKDGAVVGFSFSVTSVVLIYLFYCKPWAQLLKKMENKKKPNKRTYHLRSQACEPDVKFLKKEIQEIAEVTLLTLRMSFMDLCSATDYFNVNNAIGVGMSGIMYKTNLPNGWSLAVKRLYNSEFSQRQFHLEMSILVWRHKNMVPLLGFCVEKKERILVYQYMSNGKLSDWLGEAVGLEWPVRVRIALGLARSLSWLHHSLHYVHLSVSSECVLLDQNFEPKLPNFGEAKFWNQNTNDDGSNNEQGFVKRDVYDFGIVLFELITGEVFGQKTEFFNNSEGTFATHTTCLLQNPAAFSDTIDKCLTGRAFDGEILSLLTVARDCVQTLPDQRPIMLEIYNKMSDMWERHGQQNEDSETPKQSAISSVGTGGHEIVELE